MLSFSPRPCLSTISECILCYSVLPMFSRLLLEIKTRMTEPEMTSPPPAATAVLGDSLRLPARTPACSGRIALSDLQPDTRGSVCPRACPSPVNGVCRPCAGMPEAVTANGGTDEETVNYRSLWAGPGKMHLGKQSGGEGAAVSQGRSAERAEVNQTEEEGEQKAHSFGGTVRTLLRRRKLALEKKPRTLFTYSLRVFCANTSGTQKLHQEISGLRAMLWRLQPTGSTRRILH